MSKLPTCTAQQVLRALRRAGFEEVRQTGSHVHLRHPVTRRRTTVSRHPGDLKRPVLEGIIKQSGLTDDEFRKLL